jgi:hypothetical protein
MNTIMVAVKFRRRVKQLPRFETPDWLPVVLALRELIESADRLCNKNGGTYEGYTNVVGIRGDCCSAMSESYRVCRDGDRREGLGISH